MNTPSAHSSCAICGSRGATASASSSRTLAFYSASSLFDLSPTCSTGRRCNQHQQYGGDYFSFVLIGAGMGNWFIRCQ